MYTGKGCPDKLQFGERKVHETQCPWSVVPCPNSGECGTLLARDITEHILVCRHACCENQQYGCDFKGREAERLTLGSSSGMTAAVIGSRV